MRDGLAVMTGMTSADLITDDDLLRGESAAAAAAAGGGQDNQEAEDVVEEMAGLSARERARLRQKRKKVSWLFYLGESRGMNRTSLPDFRACRRHGSSRRMAERPSGPRQRSRRRQVRGVLPLPRTPTGRGASRSTWMPFVAVRVHGSTFSHDAQRTERPPRLAVGSWPLQPLCEELVVDLLNPRWETRHGAACAIKEILITAADRAAIQVPVEDPELPHYRAPALGHVTREMAAAALAHRAAWIEDCVLRLVCVLALDRFGDYMGGKILSPCSSDAWLFPFR